MNIRKLRYLDETMDVKRLTTVPAPYLQLWNTARVRSRHKTLAPLQVKDRTARTASFP